MPFGRSARTADLMYERTNDECLFKRLWHDEATNTPRWMQDGNGVWGCTWDDFRGFCEQCERIYTDGNSLLYVERIGNNANIHFSIIRGEKVDVTDLIRVRNELLRDYEMIFGFCGTHNRGLKKILEACGLRENGFTMYHGFSHSKLLTWKCYSIHRDALNISIATESLLNF